MDGWKTILSFPFGAKSQFSGAFTVSFREGTHLDRQGLQVPTRADFGQHGTPVWATQRWVVFKTPTFAVSKSDRVNPD